MVHLSVDWHNHRGMKRAPRSGITLNSPFPTEGKLNQSKQCSHKSPHPSMHTPGFLCLGLFNTNINNHIPKLFQGWAVSVAIHTFFTPTQLQLPGPSQYFFPGKSNTTTADPRDCPTTASLGCRQKCMRKLWKGWEGKQAEGSNAGGGERTAW